MDHWDEEEIPPAQIHKNRETKDEAPRRKTHTGESFWWKITQLPKNDRGEHHEDRHKQPASDEEIPKGSVRSMGVEVNRSHGLDHRIYAPLGINLVEPHCMSDCQKQKEDRGNPVEQRGPHCPCQITIIAS